MVASSTGTITNKLTWTGTVSNAGTFNNNAGATVSGLLTNRGTTNNAGTLSGGLTNTAGMTNNTGSIVGTTMIRAADEGAAISKTPSLWGTTRHCVLRCFQYITES
jgi:hypothetical protein